MIARCLLPNALHIHGPFDQRDDATTYFSRADAALRRDIEVAREPPNSIQPNVEPVSKTAFG